MTYQDIPTYLILRCLAQNDGKGLDVYAINMEAIQGTIPMEGTAPLSKIFASATAAIRELGVRPDGQVVWSYIEE